MSYDGKLQKAWENYRRLADRAVAGDRQAHQDKARAREEARQIEREAARAGEIVTPLVDKAGKVTVKTREVPSKRDRQIAYIDRFDNTKIAAIGTGPEADQPIVRDPQGNPSLDANGNVMRGTPQTLKQYHSKRLLGKNIQADTD